jgi:hypothetical protein
MQRIAGPNHGNRYASTIAAVRRLTTLICCLALGAAACGRQDEHHIRAACKGGPEPLRAALAGAPGEVRLQGTLLSGCFVRSSDPGDIQIVGAAYVSVAADLATEARGHPESAAATRLGYLVGAARRGAARTQGIHDELVRRLEQELGAIHTGSAAFRRGERAGRTSG